MSHRRPPIERFTALYAVDEAGCWIWAGFVKSNGYAQFRPGGMALPVYAHRWSFEYFVRPLEEGKWVDHLCRVRHCVNPEHLEAVSPRKNLLRGETIPAQLAARTHCNHGHEFTPENTVMNRGYRRCRICRDTTTERGGD